MDTIIKLKIIPSIMFGVTFFLLSLLIGERQSFIELIAFSLGYFISYHLIEFYKRHFVDE